MTPLQIKIALLEAGIEQKEIAKRIGVTPPAVSQVIHGISSSIKIRRAVAEALGKSIDDLWPNGTRRRGRPASGCTCECE